MRNPYVWPYSNKLETFFIWLMLGLVTYFVYWHRRSKLDPANAPAVAEEEPTLEDVDRF